MRAREIVESRIPSKYVYHAAYLPRGLRSVLEKGLLPSKTGYSGPGVYFAYDPNSGFYHVSPEEATMFRVRWSDLVDRFGTYPSNPNGIQRDDDEIIVPGRVSAELLEVEVEPGLWQPLLSLDKKPLDEVNIDNRKGWGSTPYNQDVDYFGLRVKMRPSKFLKLAAYLAEPTSQKDIEQHIQSGGSIGAPFLQIDIPEEWMNGDLSQPAQVVSHEGRNRMHAVRAVEGDEPVEVHLFFPGLRRRHLTDAMIERLQQGLNAERMTVEIPGPTFFKF